MRANPLQACTPNASVARAGFGAAAALAAVALLAMPAMAQTASQQIVTIDSAKALTYSLAPGESTTATLVVSRSCQSAAQVLPAGTIEVRIISQDGFVVVTGTSSVAVEQMVCAQQTRQMVTLPYQVTARSDAGLNDTMQSVVEFRAIANAHSALDGGSSEAAARMLFSITPDSTSQDGAQAVVKSDSRSSPGAGIEVAGALFGLVALARRRLA